ncbi:unnamed protein product, partial [Medioppia subpectinata]
MRSGPWNFLCIIGFYLYVCKVLGPRLMKNRPAFELTQLIRHYNLLMSLFNLWFFTKILSITNYGIDTWMCPKNPISDERNRESIFLGWILLMSRLVELMDTIFFILRKSHHQISALHLFHHTVVPICIWFPLKLTPEVQYGFGPLINSFIHVIMYFYYYMSTFGPAVRPYLWWKRYLTGLQLIQFMLIIVNCLRVFVVADCGLSHAFMSSLVFIACVLFVLFLSFYYNTYN